MIESILNIEINLFGLSLSPKKLVKNPLFSGSAIMIIGSNLGNLFAYLYHLIIGRLLGPASYGELAAVISFMGIVSASFSFLSLVVVKFVSAADSKHLPKILSWFNHKALILGIVIGSGIGLLSPVIANFLHLNVALILILAVILFLSVISLTYRSFLQGLLKFKETVITTNVDALSRLTFGAILVYLGFSTAGALAGFALSGVVSFFLLRYFLREYKLTGAEEEFSRTKEVVNFAIPILVSSVATNSLYSTDVVLIKHFFSSHDAGIYAAVSNLGKIIFFGTAPVASVMFPIISKRHSQGGNYKKIFIMSLLLVAGIATGVILIYWLFPELMVNLLYGSEFLEAKKYLVPFGFFISLYTLSSVILNYFLSRDKTKVSYFVAIIAALQAIGIYFFHESIGQAIRVSIGATALMFIGLFIYFLYERKETK